MLTHTLMQAERMNPQSYELLRDFCKRSDGRTESRQLLFEIGNDTTIRVPCPTVLCGSMVPP